MSQCDGVSHWTGDACTVRVCTHKQAHKQEQVLLVCTCCLRYILRYIICTTTHKQTCANDTRAQANNCTSICVCIHINNTIIHACGKAAREGLVACQASMEEAGTRLLWRLACQASAPACLSSLTCPHEAGTRSTRQACQASTKLWLANKM